MKILYKFVDICRSQFVCHFIINIVFRKYWPDQVSYPCSDRRKRSRYILFRVLLFGNCCIRPHNFITLSSCRRCNGNRPVSPSTASVGVDWDTPMIFLRYLSWAVSNTSIGNGWYHISQAYSSIGRICLSNTFRYKCSLVNRGHGVTLGLYSLSGRTSYHKISLSIEAARVGFKLFQSLWNLTGTSAAPLLRCLSNCRASRPLKHPISRLRDFETSRDLAVRRLIA